MTSTEMLDDSTTGYFHVYPASGQPFHASLGLIEYGRQRLIANGFGCDYGRDLDE